jgi:hypothetical protein
MSHSLVRADSIVGAVRIRRRTPPGVPGPLVRARLASVQDLVFDQPGDPNRLVAWVLAIQAGMVTTMALSGGVQAVWGPLLTMLLGNAIAIVPSQLRRRRGLRRLVRLPVTERLADVEPGALVRLRGVIEEQNDSFAAPGTQRASVYARTVLLYASEMLAGSHTREDVRGVPFYLRLPDGNRVRLDPSSVRTVDPLAPLRETPVELLQSQSAARRVRDRQLFRQITLSPGECIEALGCLVRDVHPDGQAAPGRGVPLHFTLAAGPEDQVTIRKRRRF